MSPVIGMIRVINVCVRRLIMIVINIYVFMHGNIPLHGNIFMRLHPGTIICIHRRLSRTLVKIMIAGIVAASVCDT